MKKFFAIVALMLSVMTVNAQENEVYIQFNPSTLHIDGRSNISPFGIAAGYNRLFDIGCDHSLKRPSVIEPGHVLDNHIRKD